MRAGVFFLQNGHYLIKIQDNFIPVGNMISRSFTFVVFLCLGTTALVSMAPVSSASAQDLIAETMQTIADKKAQLDEIYADKEKQFIDKQSNDQRAFDIELANREVQEDMRPATDQDIREVAKSVPGALAFTSNVMNTLMLTRSLELNRVPMPEDKVSYMVDSSWKTPVDVQSFDIFMRFFCDPDSNSGRMKDLKVDMVSNPSKLDTNEQKKEIEYKLGCGNVEGDSIETRHKILGSDDTKAANREIIGLPLRVSDMFFAPTTFSTEPNASVAKLPDGSAGDSNTNPMAQVYFGAFAQSLRFLLGSAPTGGTPLAQKEAVTRQMLASLPFAILFSERVGSMGTNAAEALAETLSDKLGSSVSTDEALANRVDELRRRNSVSIAEYMDIMMYQLPTSPGYYTRINTQLTTKQLVREEVWLTAMQTALNYQRNRWLEILTLLEAVKK